MRTKDFDLTAKLSKHKHGSSYTCTSYGIVQNRKVKLTNNHEMTQLERNSP